MPTRRTLLTAVAALGLGAGTPDPYDRLLQGEGDLSAALPALAGVRFRGGVVQKSVARGLADVVGGRALSPASPARIASISKLVTALGFMTLVEAGRVGLDDPASDLLGFDLRHPSFPKAVITPRRLLSHTSGLRNGPSYPVAFGRPLSAALTPGGVQWDDGAWFGPPDQPPGDWFAYGDVNYAVIAQIIERISGERFDRFMQRAVFAPLGLTCGFNWSGVPQAARDRRAVLYRKALSDAGPWDPAGPWIAQQDETVPAAPLPAVRIAPEAENRPLTDYVPGENGFVFGPQGGLRASVLDLAVIGAVLTRRGAPLLRPESFAILVEPVWRLDPRRPNGDGYGGLIAAYGLGVQTLTGGAGDHPFDGCEGWIGHAGDAYGLSSGLWVDPRSGQGLAWLLTGRAAPLEAHLGRSRLTRQEERLAGLLLERAI